MRPAAQLKVGSQRDKPREQLGLFENNHEVCAGNPVGFVELYLLSRNRMSADIVIGRTLACCLHPAAAWRRLSASGKALIVGTYFVAGYLAVLVLLFAR